MSKQTRSIGLPLACALVACALAGSSSDLRAELPQAAVAAEKERKVDELLLEYRWACAAPEAGSSQL